MNEGLQLNAVSVDDQPAFDTTDKLKAEVERGYRRAKANRPEIRDPFTFRQRINADVAECKAKGKANHERS